MSQVQEQEVGITSRAAVDAQAVDRETQSWVKGVLSYLGFLAVAAGALGAILGLIMMRQNTQGAIATVSDLLPFGYAFAAGMIASVNPCGFFMLPSYVSYHLGIDEKDAMAAPVHHRLSRALLLGLVATLGFIAIFSLVGYIIAEGGRWLVDFFPVAGLIIGAVMIGLGLWLLMTHRSFGILPASRAVVTPRRNVANIFLFGIAYAVCSLSCTLPVFLVVVGSALASRGVADSLLQFLSYSLGMGVVLVGVTISAAVFKGALARSLRSALPHIHTVSAMFLTGAGIYITYYWIKNGELFS